MGARSLAATFMAAAVFVFALLRMHCGQQPAFNTPPEAGGGGRRRFMIAANPTTKLHAAVAAAPATPRLTLPPHFIAVITAAQLSDATQQAERDVEYARSLPYFFNHFESVYCVASGVSPWPLVDALPFTAQPLHFTSSLKSKSAKEAEALRAFVREVNGSLTARFPTTLDDVIVFKASGRYQIVRDDVLRTVRDTAASYDVWWLTFGDWYVRDGALLFDPGDNLAMTFFIAMRWTLFRDFFETVDLEKLNSWGPYRDGYDVERAIVDFVKERPDLRAYPLKHLHVVANIGGAGVLRYF